MKSFRVVASSVDTAFLLSLPKRLGSWLRARLRGRGASQDTGLGPTFSVVLRDGGGAETRTTLASLRREGAVPIEVIVWRGDREALFEPNVAGIESRQAGPRPKIEQGAGLRGSIERSRGDFVILLDAGDELLAGALDTFSSRIRHSEFDLVYCDETYIDGCDRVARPVLKPSWSPDLLTSYDYLGHATAIRRSVALDALTAGETEPAGSAAAEWDLKLKVAARTRKIERVAKILCRRNGPGSPRDILVAEARELSTVLADHWKRQGHDAQIRTMSDGSFHAIWPVDESLLVTVIIPNKDNAGLLRTCIEGLLDRTSYRTIEVVVVDNGSTDPDTLALYVEIERKGVRLVPFDEPFNYSRACNLGAAQARGELLLFLNNDIEIIDAEWLTTLVREAVRPGVGIVGPKLVYPDGEIQHAGVALGLFELSAHVFHRAPHARWGPFGSPDTKRNYLAVTGACHLMRRTVFDLVAGYDEAFRIAYSDIALCLDAWRLGFRTVYVPAAGLVHHEGASRGFANPTDDQVVFTRRLRALGIAEDPYFHPDLHASSFIPTYVAPRGGVVSMPMRECIERFVGPTRDQAYPDVHDDGAVADAMEADWACVAEPFDATTLKAGADAGASIMIALLRRRRDLRARFPTALNDGATGGFAEWVKAEGLALLGLGPEFGAFVDAAFAANPGTSALKYLVHDLEFRRSHPLFLVPNGRSDTCAHLFKAVSNGTLRRVDVGWFLVQSAEAPLQALYDTWAVTPEWQRAVPDGATALGATRLIGWIADTYGIGDDWLFEQRDADIMDAAAQLRLGFATIPAWGRAFPGALSDPGRLEDWLHHLSSPASGVPFRGRDWAARQNAAAIATDLARPGLNILGHFSYPSGLRTSTESIVAGLQANDVALSLRDVPTFRNTDDLAGPFHRGVEIFDTTLIHVQPDPFFNEAYRQSHLEPRSARTYRIAFWYWELEEVPDSWNRPAFDCDEFWTATGFVADALRRRFRQPVKTFMPGIEMPAFKRHSKSYFGLREDRFVFLFVFHMTSVIDRKNPLGLIKAFRAAFSPGEPVDLVVKTTFGAGHPEQFPALAEAARAADVILIDKEYSRDETLALIEASDAYVSLHRSEGLGLSMAEAMLLERPVIASRYSGNLEFMNDANSLLVDCRMVAVGRDIPPYEAGSRWADPSTEIAAKHMRRLYEDRGFARSLGTRAKADLEARLSYRAAGAAMARRLREIDAMRRGVETDD